MPTTKPTISIRLDDDIKEALRRYAKVDRRSLSQYLQLTLEAHVKEREKQEGKR